jgi:hypothetical protein
VSDETHVRDSSIKHTSGLLATREVDTSFTDLCFVPILQDLQVTDQGTSLQSILVSFFDIGEVEEDII